MTTVQDIAVMVEKLAPKHLCEDWDNVGLLVGERNMAVTGVLTTLDVTLQHDCEPSSGDF